MSDDITSIIAGSVTNYTTAIEVLRGRLAHDRTDVIPADMRDMYEGDWAEAFIDRVWVVAHGNRRPKRMDHETLAAILSDMAARVAAGDSFDGSISYETDYEGGEPGFGVIAAYQVGNAMGQGGTRIIEGGEG